MNIGDKWKDWTIDSLIGEGTFGKVYKVVRNEFGRTYESALKVIRVPQSSSELNAVVNEGMDKDSITTYFRSMVDDIVDEFTLMSELRGHSNIVSYEDHSVMPIEEYYGWEICIRMELVTPLYKHLADHPITIRDVIELGIDMCKALEVCQKFNLIHRDIKPENIFVSSMDTYKLGDFGIARQMEKANTGMSKKGTYSYMAPEVYKGQPYDSTVDIYSLGIVLYRFLNNNRTPFLPPYPEDIRYSDRERANVRRMSGDTIPSPCNATGRLAEIVLKACAYNPKDRYERPEDMRRALEAILYNDEEARLIYPSGDGLQKVEASSASLQYIQPDDEDDDATVALIEPAEEIGKQAVPVPADPDASEDTMEDPVLMAIKTDSADSEESEATAVLDDVQKAEINTGAAAAASVAAAVSAPKPSQDKTAEKKAETEPVKELKKAEAKAADKEKQTAAKDKGKKTDAGDLKKKKPLIIAAAAAVILAAVLIPFGYKYFHHLVPDVAGLDAEGAQAMIEYAGLTYEEDRQFSEDVARGNVISQSNEAGSYLKKGAPVEVVISKGKPIPAPKLKGKTLKEAKSEVKKLGLALEVGSEEYSDTLGKDKIISQDIKKGTECEAGQVITVVKSKGITQVKVADVIGKGVDDATAELEKAGFTVEVNGVYSSSAVDTIVEQSVEGGKTADKGSTITLGKSIGPQPVRSSGGGGSSKKKSKKKSSGGGSSSWGDGNW